MSSLDLTPEQNQSVKSFRDEIEAFDTNPGMKFKTFWDEWIEGKIPEDRVRSLDLNSMTAGENLAKALQEWFKPELKGFFVVVTYLVGDDLWEVTL